MTPADGWQAQALNELQSLINNNNNNDNNNNKKKNEDNKDNYYYCTISVELSLHSIIWYYM